MAVYKHGNSWTVQVSWYINYLSVKKEKYKIKGGFRTKSQAKKWENKQIASQKIRSQMKIMFLQTTSGNGQ